MISVDGREKAEIRRKITLDNTIYFELIHIFKTKNILMQIKMCI